jgi:hypothetical protein
VAGVPGGSPTGSAPRAGRPGCRGRLRGQEGEDGAQDWDEALHKAREDLAGARTLAAEWEA